MYYKGEFIYIVFLFTGKSFPLKGNLLFHQRSHNKGSDAERPFRCDLCDKDFMCKGHLVSHRRSHSGERPHACPSCGKTFVEKGSMLRHLRKHTNENGHPPQQSTEQVCYYRLMCRCLPYCKLFLQEYHLILIRYGKILITYCFCMKRI